MKMSEITSSTWKKVAEIPTTDFSCAGIEKVIEQEFGEPFFDDIENAIKEGYITIHEDGIIVWMS